MKQTTVNASKYTLTRTAALAAFNLGFTKADLDACFTSPKAVYPNRQREGQWRVAAKDVCMVGVYEGDSFKVITVIRNGSKAPVKVA